MLKEEQKLVKVYPQSTEINYIERSEMDNPIEGDKSSAVVRKFYGSETIDKTIELFYRQELSKVGWSYTGEAGGKLYSYRRIYFKKEEVSLDLLFWYREDFFIQFPEIDISSYTTLYEVHLLGPDRDKEWSAIISALQRNPPDGWTRFAPVTLVR